MAGPESDRRRSGWLARSVQAVVVLPFLAVLGMALWFQFSGPLRAVLLGGLGVVLLGLGGLWLCGQGRMVWLGSGAILIAALAWWSAIGSFLSCRGFYPGRITLGPDRSGRKIPPQ